LDTTAPTTGVAVIPVAVPPRTARLSLNCFTPGSSVASCVTSPVLLFIVYPLAVVTAGASAIDALIVALAMDCSHFGTPI